MHGNDQLFVRIFLTVILLHNLNRVVLDMGVGHPVDVRTALPVDFAKSSVVFESIGIPLRTLNKSTVGHWQGSTAG